MRQAVELAEAVVTHCARSGRPVTNFQLQGLLCYMQAYAMRKGKPLYPELREPHEGWPFLCVPSAYYHFGGWGAGEIVMEFDVPPLTADELAALNYSLDTLTGKGVYK